ncbi:hypothetical protein B0H14DRAFT_2628279 [Mycena olivaceomarginata]|nr:hypothetical protein B0H14DRAFT_2628279 [Mycena olivaceomarginata]
MQDGGEEQKKTPEKSEVMLEVAWIAPEYRMGRGHQIRSISPGMGEQEAHGPPIKRELALEANTVPRIAGQGGGSGTDPPTVGTSPNDDEMPRISRNQLRGDDVFTRHLIFAASHSTRLHAGRAAVRVQGGVLPTRPLWPQKCRCTYTTINPKRQKVCSSFLRLVYVMYNVSCGGVGTMSFLRAQWVAARGIRGQSLRLAIPPGARAEERSGGTKLRAQLELGLELHLANCKEILRCAFGNWFCKHKSARVRVPRPRAHQIFTTEAASEPLLSARTLCERASTRLRSPAAPFDDCGVHISLAGDEKETWNINEMHTRIWHAPGATSLVMFSPPTPAPRCARGALRNSRVLVTGGPRRAEEELLRVWRDGSTTPKIKVIVVEIH